MNSPQPDLLLTLQAIRLAGLANETAILDRVFASAEQLDKHLRSAAESGSIDRLEFADLGGFVLTESGRAQLKHLLAAEVAAAGAADVLGSVIAEFEKINGPFVETVSRWQLDQPPDSDLPALLAELDAFAGQLRQVLAPLTGKLPRFARYPAQFDQAVSKSKAEGFSWVTGVGKLSAHTVWAEVHADLLSTADRPRGQTRSASSAGDQK